MSSKPPPNKYYTIIIYYGALFICLFHGTYQISIISLLQIYKIILFSQKPEKEKANGIIRNVKNLTFSHKKDQMNGARLSS